MKNLKQITFFTFVFSMISSYATQTCQVKGNVYVPLDLEKQNRLVLQKDTTGDYFFHIISEDRNIKFAHFSPDFPMSPSDLFKFDHLVLISPETDFRLELVATGNPEHKDIIKYNSTICGPQLVKEEINYNYTLTSNYVFETDEKNLTISCISEYVVQGQWNQVDDCPID